MQNYVQVTLSDGRRARVNREKITKGVGGSDFYHVLTIVGTSDRYYYRCVDEILDDPLYLAVDIAIYLQTAPHIMSEKNLQGRYDFKFNGEQVQVHWTTQRLDNTVEIKIYAGTEDIAPYSVPVELINNKEALQDNVIRAICDTGINPTGIYARWMHDFIYQDEKVECRWAPNGGEDRAWLMVNVFEYAWGMMVDYDLLGDQMKLEAFIKKELDERRGKSEDLTSKFIRACQSELGGEAKITTITVDTKTKEITVSYTDTHKLFL